MSGSLVWLCIRDNNAFLRKGLNGTIFSAEAGNLYNKHSYKYSGLANTNTVDVQAKGDAATVRYGPKKAAKQNKPRAQAAATFTVKSNARRALVAIGKQVASYRPDLKKPAVARMAAVQKSLRVKKATKSA